MMKSYTELDLLRFIYKEVEICEYFEINNAIEEDDLLREDFRSLKKGIDTLPKVTVSPSDVSMKNILGYAAA